MRVYEFSKKYSISTKKLIEILQEGGFRVKNHMATLDDDAIEFLTGYMKKPSPKSAKKKSVTVIKNESSLPEKQEVSEKIEDTIAQSRVLTCEPMNLGLVAERMEQSVNDIILTLLRLGTVATKNQILSEDIIKKLAEHYGFEVKEPLIQKDELQNKITVAQDGIFQERAPIVVVMGHVDHGKTTLLDYIRSTRLAAREKGGITQHIGAYEAHTAHGNIIFLDTPGHEAFFKMRQRGTRVADIAVLVVAADDGVMPQTIEAIKHAKAMNVPIIVAINKIDKVDVARLEVVKRQLAQYDLLPEEWGGTVICIPISAKTGTGVDQLLEMILLQSHLMELRANISGLAQGYILESRIEKGHGSVATVICQHGNISVGDFFVSGQVFGCVTTLIDSHGKNIKKIGPGYPVQVAGFDSLPEVGDSFKIISKQEYLKLRQDKKKQQRLGYPAIYQMGKDKTDTHYIIFKTDTNSTKEALIESVGKLAKKLNTSFSIVSAGVGDISESDIELAYTTNAHIIGLHVKAESNASHLAHQRGVIIKLFDIIYKLLEDIEAYVTSTKSIELVQKKIGQARVLRVFDIKNVGVIAGCMVTNGRFVRNGFVKVLRQGEKIGEGAIMSLQREKKMVKEVHSGFECGFIIDGFSGWEVDDIAECYIQEQKK